MPASELDKQCLRLLTKAGQKPWGEESLGLQLVAWMLENHPSELPDPAAKFADRILNEAMVMAGWSPANTESWLENGGGLIRQLKSIDDPKEAAAILVENLYWNLQLDRPSLRLPITE